MRRESPGYPTTELCRRQWRCGRMPARMPCSSRVSSRMFPAWSRGRLNCPRPSRLLQMEKPSPLPAQHLHHAQAPIEEHVEAAVDRVVPQLRAHQAGSPSNGRRRFTGVGL